MAPGFPEIDAVALPCHFLRVIPGAPHPDGRRYLPTIVLQVTASPGNHGVQPVSPLGVLLGVVDRHHVVSEAHAGQAGIARLVFLLGRIELQALPPRQGFVPDRAAPQRGYTGAPQAFGQVVQVYTWETQRGILAYESLFTELLLDVGGGTIGIRTHATADRLERMLGAGQVSPGDWLRAGPARIDILGFEPRG